MVHPPKSISDETLLGYLLSALSQDEQNEIDRLALTDESLRMRIGDLRMLLAPIEASNEPFEPRSDLVGDTMALVAQQSEELRTGERTSIGLRQQPFEACAATKMAWVDSLAVLTASILVLCVMLPSVWYARESARKISCSDNLMEVGKALSNFASLNLDRRLPRIDPQGPLSFAGVYSIRLKDAGLLPVSKWLWCPAIDVDAWDPGVPTLRDYISGTPSQQRSWRYTSGGTYSFNLGNMVDGAYSTPRINGVAYFAVMGDTLVPVDESDWRESSHGLNQANVLYGDGRVQFVRLAGSELGGMVDNPYLNRDNIQAAGIGTDDCCLGPGFQNPLWPIRHRCTSISPSFP